jgi:hypothetical protein
MNPRPTLKQIIQSITFVDIICTLISALCAFLIFVLVGALTSNATDICRISRIGDVSSPVLHVESCEPTPGHDYWWWVVVSAAELHPQPGLASTNYNPWYKLTLDLDINQPRQFLQLLDLTEPSMKDAFTARAKAGRGKLIPATWIRIGDSHAPVSAPSNPNPTLNPNLR